MEKVLIIDLLYHVYHAVYIGQKENNKFKVEITKKDFSSRKDRMIKIIDVDDILISISGRIEIIHLNVLL